MKCTPPDMLVFRVTIREESIEAQVRAIRKYSSREGQVIVRIRRDQVGKHHQRPAFLDMIAAAEAGV